MVRRPPGKARQGRIPAVCDPADKWPSAAPCGMYRRPNAVGRSPRAAGTRPPWAPTNRAPQCPECHANSAPTELDSSAAGDRWLQCENCGHLWRSSGPRVDAFELIVRHRSVGAKLNRGHRPPHGVPRAARYAVKLALRYRLAASIDWELGQTEDISQSGRALQNRAPRPAVSAAQTRPAGAAGRAPARAADFRPQVTGQPCGLSR